MYAAWTGLEVDLGALADLRGGEVRLVAGGSANGRQADWRGAEISAETCLFVSWCGFKTNVQKELARDFFRVRLWSRKDLLEKLFAHYEQLPEEIRIALPLKRVWMVAAYQQE